MEKLQAFLYSKTAKYIGLSILLVFFGLKAHHGGNDINVYLHASKQLWFGEDIYANNPFNNYLYSPLFAIVLWPLAFLPWELARVIWALFNLFLIFRLWKIFGSILNMLNISKQRFVWHCILVAVSAGFIIHNLNLGQMTVLCLWMTLEGILLIERDNKQWQGASLIALGINFKIIPFIALGYLFLKKQYRGLLYSVLLLGATFLVPILFLGNSYNSTLLSNWKDKINPSGEKFVFENNKGCHSLNAVLPAFFYEFPNEVEHSEKRGYSREIASIPYDTLVVVLNVCRVLLLLSVLLVVFCWQSKNKALNRYWQLAYLMLVSLLIFPHQMKYSMLYFIPTVGYVLAYFMYKKQKGILFSVHEKVILSLAAFQVFVLLIMGRDVVGDTVVDFLDYFHYMGLSNISFIAYLLILNPKKLTSQSAHAIDTIA